MGEPERTVIQDTASKMRNTPIRRCLLETVESASAPLSATDFMAELDAHGLAANKTTVYRQLDSLVSQGLLVKLDLGDGKKRYEKASGNCGHPHLLCTKCGRVTCLPVDDDLTSCQREVARKNGFVFQGCSLELYGVCGLCQSEEEN